MKPTTGGGKALQCPCRPPHLSPNDLARTHHHQGTLHLLQEHLGVGGDQDGGGVEKHQLVPSRQLPEKPRDLVDGRQVAPPLQALLQPGTPAQGDAVGEQVVGLHQHLIQFVLLPEQLDEARPSLCGITRIRMEGIGIDGHGRHAEVCQLPGQVQRQGRGAPLGLH